MNHTEKLLLKMIQDNLKKAYNIETKKEDYYGKSGEGSISISTYYPNYWTSGDFYQPETFEVTVYSYVFGPNRNHEFSGRTLKEALIKAGKAVQEWTKQTILEEELMK